MAIKRKAVAQSAQELFGGSKVESAEVDDEAMEPEVQEEEIEEQEQAETTSKSKGAQMVAKEEVEDKPEVKTAAEQEKETVEARKKELKSMYVDQLKELMTSHDLELGNRNYMIEKITSHEAKLRKVQREKEAQIRAVILSKKEEFDALSTPALKKLCDEAGMKGVSSKTNRVQELMRRWQEADGIDKALQKIAQDKRHEVLSDMEAPALLKLCKKANLDPYVKDIMVARIVRKEHEAGQFARPSLVKQMESDSNEKSCDVIDDFLAKEANRKKELELKKQRDEALSKRIAELKDMSVEKLQKLVAKNGLDAKGKKEEMMVALLNIDKQKAAIDARRQELKSMGKEALTDFATRHGIKKGSVDTMVTCLLELEEKRRAELAAYEVKLEEVLSRKKAQLETKTLAELKELCVSKGVKLGTGKEERITNLISAAREDDEVHKTLEKIARDARKEALLAVEKPLLLKLCEEYEVDPLVPEVMVELLLEHEIEEGDVKEPAAKKARASK